MSVVAIIPARYGSTRFPGKPLARIGTKPMIQHVYESTATADLVHRTLVATDDPRILDAVRAFGGEAVMTSKDHLSGTDRLAEVAGGLQAEWVVNVQGDLPFIQTETIRKSVDCLVRDPAVPMATARTPITSEREFLNPNVVKVVTDQQGFACYFSRAPIPFHREPPAEPVHWGHRHLGIYVYRRDFLMRIASMPAVDLELTEGLEQLRALYYGFRIRVADVVETGVEVDTPDDLKRAEAYWSRLQSSAPEECHG
jgi:3-deoxy-manno-octulosonate cytidylyltransferase (CMP-KDO synthetase)